MNLISKIKLTYPDGVKSTSITSEILYGFIIECQKNFEDKSRKIFYKYMKRVVLQEAIPEVVATEGIAPAEAIPEQVEYRVVRQGSKLISSTEAQALFNSVFGTLPVLSNNSNNLELWDDALYYEAMRVEMAAYYEVTVADIDLIP